MGDLKIREAVVVSGDGGNETAVTIALKGDLPAVHTSLASAPFQRGIQRDYWLSTRSFDKVVATECVASAVVRASQRAGISIQSVVQPCGFGLERELHCRSSVRACVRGRDRVTAASWCATRHTTAWMSLQTTDRFIACFLQGLTERQVVMIRRRPRRQKASLLLLLCRDVMLLKCCRWWLLVVGRGSWIVDDSDVGHNREERGCCSRLIWNDREQISHSRSSQRAKQELLLA